MQDIFTQSIQWAWPKFLKEMIWIESKTHYAKMLQWLIWKYSGSGHRNPRSPPSPTFAVCSIVSHNNNNVIHSHCWPKTSIEENCTFPKAGSVLFFPVLFCPPNNYHYVQLPEACKPNLSRQPRLWGSWTSNVWTVPPALISPSTNPNWHGLGPLRTVSLVLVLASVRIIRTFPVSFTNHFLIHPTLWHNNQSSTDSLSPIFLLPAPSTVHMLSSLSVACPMPPSTLAN